MSSPNESVSNAGYYEVKTSYPAATEHAGRNARSFLCYTAGAIVVKRPDGTSVSIPAASTAMYRYPCQISEITSAPGDCMVFY